MIHNCYKCGEPLVGPPGDVGYCPNTDAMCAQKELAQKWQARPSPKTHCWQEWYGDQGDYLGEVSARTGPDKVKTDQPCNCNQCRPEVK